MIEITVEIAPQDKKWSTAMEMLIETIKKISIFSQMGDALLSIH